MGQKNVVEIIFDTSESMGWSVDKNSTTSRLEIARYALRELMDNIVLPSSFEYRIQYFLGCDTYLAKVDNIYSVKAYGATPLFRAIGNSLEYMFKFDKSYKKSIIILSDGEDTCWNIHHISEKDIVGFIRKNSTLRDVKIYILKIGKVSAQAEKEYSHLAKKTEGKKYLVDLNNYKKTVESIKKDLYSILNRGKLKSSFYSFMNFIRKIFFIFMSLLIFILVIEYLLVSFKSTIQKPIDSNITCTPKTLKDIAVEECVYTPKPLIKALIYPYNSSKIIVLEGFESASTKLSSDTSFFLDEIFNKKVGKDIENIDIYGHADLIPIESKQNFNECNKNGIDTKDYPNECLAFRRALGVKRAIYTMNNKLDITPHASNDFFMKDTNEKLGATLWEAMNIKENIFNLRREISRYMKIDIPTYYEPQTIREQVKASQKSLKEKYEKKFSPFRSVVIKVEEESNLSTSFFALFNQQT